jgi:hypothetical protein
MLIERSQVHVIHILYGFINEMSITGKSIEKSNGCQVPTGGGIRNDC